MFFSHSCMHCWRQREIPHNMRDAKIVTLCKNKGGKGDCNNYRGTTLLSMAGKIFARILLKHLQRLADGILPDTQSGFRAGRSMTENGYQSMTDNDYAAPAAGRMQRTKKTTVHHLC